MPDEIPRFDDWIKTRTPRGPQDRVHSIASNLGVSSDIADDYLKLTRIESSHNVNVGDSPKGAQGFGQVMPDVPGGITRTVGGRKYNLRDPDQNIAAGLAYFSEGGSDPVARRLYYFGGPRAKQHYQRTGQIPNISDGNMTASQYVKATGAYQTPRGETTTDIPNFDDWAKSQTLTEPQVSPDVAELAQVGAQANPTLITRKPVQPSTAQASTRFGAPRAQIKPNRGVGRRDVFADVVAGAGPVVPDTDFSSVPGSAASQRRSLLPVNPSKIVVRPKPFTFNDLSDEETKAGIQREVADEVARSTPQGRAPRLVGPELVAEVEARFQKHKVARASYVEDTQLGPRFQARDNRTERVDAQISDVMAKYAPGLASLDTPMGIKTDLPRGITSGLTLGAIGSEREITPEEHIANSDAGKGLIYVPLPGGGTIEFSAHELGDMAGSLAPLIGGGKVLAKVGVKLSPAKRTAILFGGLESGRQAVNAAAGREVDLSAPLMSAALGSVMGKLEGHGPSLIRRVVAYVSPGLALDVAKGASPEDAAKNALTNFGFAVGMGRGKKNAKTATMPSTTEAEQPQRFQHLQFGEVEVLADQSGAREGRLKVVEVADPEKIHYVKKADRQGRGNAQLLPIKPEVPAVEPRSQPEALAKPAIESPEVPPIREGALPATPSQPASVKAFITKADEAALRGRGYSADEIYRMKPDEAQRVLSQPQKLEAGLVNEAKPSREEARQERETAFQLPFIKPDDPGSTHRLNRTIDVVFESESGRQMTKTMTIKARQKQLEKKQKVMSRLLDCLHG